MRYEPTAPGTDALPSAADHHWLALACDLAADCPPSETAFSVGAVVVARDGTELSRGHSREAGDPVVHAEEAAHGWQSWTRRTRASPRPPSTPASNPAPTAPPAPSPAPD